METSNKLEPGKCYISTMNSDNNGKKEKQFVLEITPNKYETIKVRYSRKELNENFNGSTSFRIMTRPPHTKYVFKNDVLSEYARMKNPIGYIFCIVEVPAKYRTIFKKDIKTKELEITKVKVISKSKLLKKYVKRKPEKLKENQMFFNKGIWSELKEVIAPSCPGGFTIREVEQKLIELGYKLEVNNILEEVDKKALIDFQRKNGIKEGQFDIETLKKLGINY